MKWMNNNNKKKTNLINKRGNMEVVKGPYKKGEILPNKKKNTLQNVEFEFINENDYFHLFSWRALNYFVILLLCHPTNEENINNGTFTHKNSIILSLSTFAFVFFFIFILFRLSELKIMFIEWPRYFVQCIDVSAILFRWKLIFSDWMCFVHTEWKQKKNTKGILDLFYDSVEYLVLLCWIIWTVYTGSATAHSTMMCEGKWVNFSMCMC